LGKIRRRLQLLRRLLTAVSCFEALVLRVKRQVAPTGRQIAVGLLVIAGLAGVIRWHGKESVRSQAAQQSIRGSAKKQNPISHLQNGQRRFAIFRTPAEGVPDSVLRILPQLPHGLNWALAQALPARVLPEAWVVPGRGYICLAQRERQRFMGGSCSTTRQALDHGLGLTLLSAHGMDSNGKGRVIVGIAPVGARGVVAQAGVVMTRIPVINGLFMHRDNVLVPPNEFRLVPQIPSPRAST
jgi:hypothetical protein